MTLLIANYKITSFVGGYKLSRQKGKQWKIVAYSNSLEEALTALFEFRVRVDTKQFVVDFNNAKDFEAQQQKLVASILAAKQEIIKVAKNEHR